MRLNHFFHFLFFLGLTIYNNFIFAQNQVIVKGIIVDNKNIAIAHATISASQPGQQTVSQNDGTYQLPLPNGKHNIYCSMVGYETKDVEINITDRDTVLKLNFQLKKSNKEFLQGVTVEGISKKKVLESSGFAVNVVETKQAAFQNVQTIDLLDRSAGVRVRQDGGLGGRVEYNINGLSGNAVKIFIDGVPISHFGRSFSLNSLPPALIERIEVYKGVLPGNLSEDALGGAINVVLKKNIKSSLTSSYSYGSFNTHQWNVNGSYQFKNSLILKGAGFYNYSDNSYKVWGNDIGYYEADGRTSFGHTAKRFNDAYESKGGKIDLGFTNKKWTDQFFIGGIYSDQMKQLQHGVSMRMVYGKRASLQNSKVGLITYSKNNLLVEGLSLNINASLSSLERNNIDTSGVLYDWRGPIIDAQGNPATSANGAEQSNQGKTYSVNAEKTFVIRSNISYAITNKNFLHANILHNDFKRNMDDRMRDALWRQLQNVRDLNKQIISFTYENLSFESKLRTNLFYKRYIQKVVSHEPIRMNGQWDKKNETRNEQQNGFGITIAYKIRPRFHILASAEQAVRMPSETEMFANDVENQVANYNLRPETGRNANLGVSAGPFKLDKHALSINGNIFYRNIKDMIRRAVSANSQDVASFENLESVFAYGFDAEIQYKYNDKIQFNFNTSKFNALFNTKFNSAGARYSYYRQQIRNEPSFKFSTGLMYFLHDFLGKKAKTSIYYNTNYVHQFLRDWKGIGGTGLNWIPTQFVHDIGFTHTLPNQNITLGFDVKNILNEQVFDNYSIQKPGRAFYGKITYSIF